MASPIEHDLPLVLIEWLDANTGNEPVDADNVGSLHKPWVIHSLGWVLQDDEIGITIVTEYYDSTYRGRTFIPRGMVQSLTPFTLSRPRKKHSPEEKVGPS